MSAYSIGIDLGTTNCVIAYCKTDDREPQPQLLEIPQLVAPGSVESRSQLASFLYLPPESEAAAYQFPGGEPRHGVVGAAAQQLSAEQPDRVVMAAKSWLCHQGVDRREEILPWGAPKEIDKVSPVTASRRYLEHLAQTWNNAFPDAPLDQQQVVLTVPASFDPSARDLTREAAAAAGLPADFILLEEPQAAVYRWLAALGDNWRTEVGKGDSILVVDVGGGTTDMTLVNVTEEEGNLVLRRVAVGNHLLVGGDNMDLALAYAVSQQLAEQGHQLDPWQTTSLWHACRRAKETLLTDADAPPQSISVLGRGSRLIGGTISTELTRETVQQTIVDGFFPIVEADAQPSKTTASGFQDIGLPYESDPAISRHIAAFLAAHRDDIGEGGAMRLLLNGGVFRADQLRDRVVEMIGHWTDSAAALPLQGPSDLDHSVALGAAFYGWAKQRGGIRIRGGIPRSYYVGIETAGLAIPGAPRPLRALCVAPQGMEEGTEVDVPHREIGLVVGQPATFRFFSSTTRRDDQPGDALDRWSSDELVESNPVEVTLQSESESDDAFVPVIFHSRVTELGMFELWCQSSRDDQHWKLEFNTRDAKEVSDGTASP